MNYSPGLTAVYLVLYIFVFFAGACIGSFLNVVIYRVPRQISFTAGRSFCPACLRQLAAGDMIPVLSRLLLHGRCRYCGAPIPRRYLLVEALTGLLAAAALAVYGPIWAALAAFALIAGLVAVAFIDLDSMEIPNGLLIYLSLPALALLFLLPGVSFASHLIGFFCVSLPMFLIALLVSGAFGGGDIKLMAVCGAALGWQLILVAFFIALLIGGVQAVQIMVTRNNGLKQQFAFGPALAAGVALSILVGPDVVQWYAGLL